MKKSILKLIFAIFTTITTQNSISQTNQLNYSVWSTNCNEPSGSIAWREIDGILSKIAINKEGTLRILYKVNEIKELQNGQGFLFEYQQEGSLGREIYSRSSDNLTITNVESSQGARTIVKEGIIVETGQPAPSRTRCFAGTAAAEAMDNLLANRNKQKDEAFSASVRKANEDAAKQQKDRQESEPKILNQLMATGTAKQLTSTDKFREALVRHVKFGVYTSCVASEIYFATQVASGRSLSNEQQYFWKLVRESNTLLKTQFDSKVPLNVREKALDANITQFKINNGDYVINQCKNGMFNAIRQFMS